MKKQERQPLPSGRVADKFVRSFLLFISLCIVWYIFIYFLLSIFFLSTCLCIVCMYFLLIYFVHILMFSIYMHVCIFSWLFFFNVRMYFLLSISLLSTCLFISLYVCMYSLLIAYLYPDHPIRERGRHPLPSGRVVDEFERSFLLSIKSGQLRSVISAGMNSLFKELSEGPLNRPRSSPHGWGTSHISRDTMYVKGRHKYQGRHIYPGTPRISRNIVGHHICQGTPDTSNKTLGDARSFLKLGQEQGKKGKGKKKRRKKEKCPILRDTTYVKGHDIKRPLYIWP